MNATTAKLLVKFVAAPIQAQMRQCVQTIRMCAEKIRLQHIPLELACDTLASE